MFPNIHQYYKMRDGDLPPEVKVTEEEFVKLMMATGVSDEKAKQAAFISKQLGAATMVGGRMLRVE